MAIAQGSAKTYDRPVATPVATKVPFAFVHINKCGGSSVEIALGVAKRHTGAARMREELGHEDWARRFTFAIVRNPFDRVVSIYYYRVRTDNGGLGDRHLSVNQWIEAVWSERDPRYWNDTLLLAPSWDWVSQNGQMLVDEIARLETIDQDWAAIAARLGVAPTLDRWNSNHHPDYRLLLSPRARKVIETAFAEDFERFGYCY